jgi:hypothetical protein
MHYCPGCGTAVSRGFNCSGCGMEWLAVAEGLGLGVGSGIGFDPMDGQLAVNLGDGIGFEPGSGQMDIDIDGIDIPI